MCKIKVDVAGVGNCTSYIVKGLSYYKDNKKSPIGLMHQDIGGYTVDDVEFVAAFDCDKRKAGLDLSVAIFQEPNCTIKFCEVPKLDVEVKKGPVMDGVGKYVQDCFIFDENQAVADIVQELKDSGAEMLVNYMPVGSTEATEFYALHLFRNAFRYLRMGKASAMAWILFVIVVLFTWILFKTSARWVYYGGEAR